MKKLKRFVGISLMALMLGFSQPAHALPGCILSGYLCFFMDIVGGVVGFVVRSWTKKLNNVIYDVKPGLEKLKENIGMYQDQGKCGISATGNTGCDLVTEEEGAEMEKQVQEQEMVIPDSRIDLINKKESSDLFQAMRDDVRTQTFKQNDPANNKGCSCSEEEKAATAKDDECVPSNFDPTQCAQDRQSEAFIVAAMGAAGTADTYMARLKKEYDILDEVISEVNGKTTIADYVGGIAGLSVYASAVAVEIMYLYGDDLRMQSYRNLIASGPAEIALPTTTSGGGTK